jgi:benzylsuccinate CoA-transferase BbsF subunit
VINPGHTVTAILAAVRHVRRTGHGQMVELPQLESVVATLGTAVAEYLVNGDIPSRTGNRDPAMAPHGAFRCADDPESVGSPDRWVVIACRSDDEWVAARDALGIADGGRFDTFAARKAAEEDLEALVGGAVRERRAEEVMALLQSCGVPSGVVQNAQDLLDRDPHMKARGYYRYVQHPETGTSAYDGPAARLSETPGDVAGPAPLLGEHTMDVCERIIGLSGDEVADLLAEGVLL